MDLTIMRDTLLPAVKDAALAVKKKSSLPVLSNVLLSVDDNMALTISATDLNVFVSRTVWPKVAQVGAITVDAKALLDALKSAPKGTLLHLTTSEPETPNGSPKLVIEGVGKITLTGISADEFPVNNSFLEGEHVTTLDGSVLKRAIAEVEFAASRDVARPSLNGIFMRLRDNRIELAAADNYRIAVTQIPAEGNETQAILDLAGTLLATKILPDEQITVGQGKRFITLTWYEGTVSINTIDAQYPNYQQVIPVSFVTEVTLERDPFMAAVKAAASVVKDYNNLVRVTINGVVNIEGSSDSGDFSTNVPAEIEGDAIKIGLNAKYLGDVAKVPDADNLRWSLNNPQGPSVFRRNSLDDPWLLAVMPVRIPQ